MAERYSRAAANCSVGITSKVSHKPREIGEQRIPSNTFLSGSGNDDHTNDRIDPILDLFLQRITISIRSEPIWGKLGFIFWCIPFL